jgi:hypothetical protein
MTDQTAIEAAAKRLALALDALDAALEHRADAERGRDGITEQLHVLGADRSLLASNLDAATARARKLEAANREIARRLDAAIATIRSVLEADEPQR